MIRRQHLQGAAERERRTPPRASVRRSPMLPGRRARAGKPHRRPETSDTVISPERGGRQHPEGAAERERRTPPRASVRRSPMLPGRRARAGKPHRRPETSDTLVSPERGGRQHPEGAAERERRTPPRASVRRSPMLPGRRARAGKPHRRPETSDTLVSPERGGRQHPEGAAERERRTPPRASVRRSPMLPGRRARAGKPHRRPETSDTLVSPERGGRQHPEGAAERERRTPPRASARRSPMLHGRRARAGKPHRRPETSDTLVSPERGGRQHPQGAAERERRTPPRASARRSP